jgi:hypothetical protein
MTPVLEASEAKAAEKNYQSEVGFICFIFRPNYHPQTTSYFFFFFFFTISHPYMKSSLITSSEVGQQAAHCMSLAADRSC